MSVIRTSGKRGPLRGVGPQLVHDPYPYTSPPDGSASSRRTSSGRDSAWGRQTVAWGCAGGSSVPGARSAAPAQTAPCNHGCSL